MLHIPINDCLFLQSKMEIFITFCAATRVSFRSRVTSFGDVCRPVFDPETMHVALTSAHPVRALRRALKAAEKRVLTSLDHVPTPSSDAPTYPASSLHPKYTVRIYSEGIHLIACHQFPLCIISIYFFFSENVN